MAIVDYLQRFIESIQAINPIVSRSIIAIAILLLGFVVGKILGKMIYRILHGIELDKNTQKHINVSLEKMLAMLASIAVYVITVIITLAQLGISTIILNIILVLIIILVAVWFIMSAKDILPNVMAGILIKRHNYFKEGDRIRLRKIRGVVVKMNLTDTQLLTSNNDNIFIPNSVFRRNPVTRYK